MTGLEGPVQSQRQAEKWLPLGYFFAALVLVAVVLPTVLRPPQQAPTQSAELSPDAPPDDDQQSIISSLNRAQSGTAGGTDAGPEEVGPGLGSALASPVTQKQISGCPRGFGRPARQWQSVYAPPCAAAFSGDNGGRTWHNVTGDLVRVGVRHLVHTCTESGPIPFTPTPGESDCGRTLRVLQTFFNTTYEFYGRQLQFVSLPATADFTAPPEQQQAAAAQADQEYQVFAASTIGYKFNEELNRRGLVTFGMPSSRSRYLANAPHQWGWLPDLTLDDEIGAELVCKSLKGKAAAHAGNADLKVQERTIGVIAWATTAGGGRSAQEFVDAYRRTCGGQVKVAIDHDDASDNAASYATAIARMRAEGVTTIVANTYNVPLNLMMQAADGQGYQPEWLQFAQYGLDDPTNVRALPSNQRIHMFGFTSNELPRPRFEGDCHVAYRTADPTGAADNTTCSVNWDTVHQIANAIQVAGPKLTPAAIRDGLFKVGRRFPPEKWAVGGGYGPNDYSYADDFALMWWDNTAKWPFDGSNGAYRFTHGGERFGLGQLPANVRFFEEGVTTAA